MIRERTLGGDTIETATSYNNLACCYAALDRAVEAVAFMELSAELLRELAGEEHPRTLTVRRNLEKVRSSPKKLLLQVPNLFSLPVKDQLLIKKGKKKGKKKGEATSSGKKKD